MCCCCSAPQVCLTLCDPLHCSTKCVVQAIRMDSVQVGRGVITVNGRDLEVGDFEYR